MHVLFLYRVRPTATCLTSNAFRSLQLDLTAGEVVHGQLARFKKLGIEVSTDRAGNLAVRTAKYPGLTEPEKHPVVGQWYIPGVNATLQDFWLPLSGGVGRVHLQTEFVFEQTGGPIGARRMRLLHRAAAGGQAKLLRFLWTKSDAVGTESQSTDGLRVLDFAVEGSAESHVRCAAFILHALNNEVTDDGRPSPSADTLRRHPGSGKQCLAKYTSVITGKMQLNNAVLRTGRVTTVIHRCAASGTDDIFCMLLVPPPWPGGDGRTPELLSCMDAAGRTPQLVAAQHGNAPVLRVLDTLYKSISLTKRDDEGNDSLHLACAGGHVAAAELLLALKASVDSKNSKKQTPLHLAAGCPNSDAALSLVRSLLDRGATTSIDWNNARPAHYAMRAGNVAAAFLLVSTGTDPVHVSDNTGLSAYDLVRDALDAQKGPAKGSAGARCVSPDPKLTALLQACESKLTKEQLEVCQSRYAMRKGLTSPHAAAALSTDKAPSAGALSSTGTGTATSTGISAVRAPPLGTPALHTAVSHSSNTGRVKQASIWSDGPSRGGAGTGADGEAEDDEYAYVDEEGNVSLPSTVPTFQREVSSNSSLPPRNPAFGRNNSSTDAIRGSLAPPDPLSLARQR